MGGDGHPGIFTPVNLHLKSISKMIGKGTTTKSIGNTTPGLEFTPFLEVTVSPNFIVRRDLNMDIDLGSRRYRTEREAEPTVDIGGDEHEDTRVSLVDPTTANSTPPTQDKWGNLTTTAPISNVSSTY